MNFAQFLHLSYWFDVSAVRMSPGMEILFFVLFALMIIAGSVFRIMRKSRTDKFDRQILARASSLTTVFGLIGLAWLFFTFEEIPDFGMRFWFVLGAVFFIYFLGRIFYYAKYKVPKLRLQEQSKAEANKYLPRSARR